jgi:hypothetical protein
MRTLGRKREGSSLLIVTGWLFIAALLIASLLGVVMEKAVRGKREAAAVKARGLAQAGLARALEAYPEALEVNDESFGEGYYSNRVEAISKDRIEVTSWGKIHKEASRLPAIRLTTEWKKVAGKNRSTFRPLAWKEDRVSSLPPGEACPPGRG